jgi:hypothetical protein
LERHLAANGLAFQERISVLEVDPGSTKVLFTLLPIENVPVTAGTTPQAISRNRTMNVSRGDLVDDVRLIGGVLRSLGDQIRCRIEITPLGLPVPISELTDQENLPRVPGALD